MAKAKAIKTPQISTRERRQQQREEVARKRRNQNLMVAGGGAVLVLLIGLVLYLNFRAQAPLDGEEVFNTQGNSHIDQGSLSPIEYNSTPPSSGPHYGNLVAWQVYTEPIRYEQLIHNLEDGGVIIYYQCEDGCPDLVEEIAGVAQPFIDAGRHVVVAPNDPNFVVGGSQPLHKDMGSRIAVVAWQRTLKMDEFDGGRIRAFIEKYEGIDHHVRGIG